jgi:hypothetical protein
MGWAGGCEAPSQLREWSARQRSCVHAYLKLVEGLHALVFGNQQPLQMLLLRLSTYTHVVSMKMTQPGCRTRRLNRSATCCLHLGDADMGESGG